jgi:hypothetical protein
MPSDSEIIRAIARKVDGINLRLDDMLSSIHRLETEVGAVRGSLSGMRRGCNTMSERYYALELRLRALEGDPVGALEGDPPLEDGDAYARAR